MKRKLNNEEGGKILKSVESKARLHLVCRCGNNMDSNFPAHIAAKVQYDAGVESFGGYLHARQYMPYQRMKEFFRDVMRLGVSVGGINNILNRLHKKHCHITDK